MARPWLLPQLLVFVLFGSAAGAATHVWTGAVDDRFSNALNWIGGSPAGDPLASISFPTSSRLTATNDLTALTVQSISFSGRGFTISGNSMQLGADATVIDTSQDSNTIAIDLELRGDVAIAVTGTIYDKNGLIVSGAITGNGGVTLLDGGHLVYAGTKPNTYSGTTRVLFGELQLKKAPNVTSIAGPVEVAGDGFNYHYGYLSVFNDEQIANSAHVTVGASGTFGCAATETLGPLTIMRGARVQTAAVWSGVYQMTGTVIFAGDIDIAGDAQGDINMYGTFLIDGMRTLNADPGWGIWRPTGGLGQKSAGSGLIVTGGTWPDGAFSSTVAFSKATYDGPTIIRGGSVSIDAPRSALDLQNGRYSGHCRSLTAKGGVINLPGGVTSESDVKLSSGVTIDDDTSTALRLNGTLELGGATLKIISSPSYKYGASYTVIDNASTKAVIGTFADLPEGSLVGNRFRISYVGGDGNDVTLTDVGLIPPNLSFDILPTYPQTGSAIDFRLTVGAYGQAPTGTVTFSANNIVLGAADVITGIAKLTGGASLPRGQYSVTAAYSGDSRFAAASATRTMYVVAPTPTITSMDPSTVTGGVKTTLTIHGTNFVEGSSVVIGSTGVSTTFVSSTELRIDYSAYATESDYQTDVWVSQPDLYGRQESGHFKLNVKGVTKPPSPFTFGADLTTKLKGVTPGAVTLWFVVGRAGNWIYDVISNVTDTDADGVVSLAFPSKVTALPPYGVWMVADLDAHAIFYDNPTRTAPPPSSFPASAFLRDSEGNYTHVQIAAGGNSATMFTWARPGVGVWLMSAADGGRSDGDGSNGRVTFETSAMQPVGAAPPPPAEGIRPGDMFLLANTFGTAWAGDTVDAHLAESNGPGTLAFAVAYTNAAENGGVANLLVERTGGTDGSVTVSYATADDTAIAGKNYIAQAGSLTFSPGEVFKTITIPLIDDAAYGGTAQFKVNLTNVKGASLGSVAAHTVVVADNEAPPLLSLRPSSRSVTEGDVGQVNIPVTVNLTGPTSLPVTVSAYWSEGQYGGSNVREVRFAPGETEKTFTVSYLANTKPELDRTISVGIGNPQNATLSSESVAKLTIVDDDFAAVSITDGSVAENGGSVVLALQLSCASQKPITVTYETRNLTALGGSDYVTKTGAVTVTSGSSSISIPIINDISAEPTEVFEVVLTSVSGAKLARSTAAVAIIDDDSPKNATGVPAMAPWMLVLLFLGVTLFATRRIQ